MTSPKDKINPLVVEKLGAVFPDHTLMNCPTSEDVVLLWPNTGKAKDVYEFSVSVINEEFPKQSDAVVKHLTRPKPLLERPRVHVAYKDYRVVDSSHVNKLHSLLHETYVESKVADVLNDAVPIIYGTLTLPGNFVLTQDFNKTIHCGTFDSSMGKKYLKDKMEVSADAKLWELEGYRLYRSLMTIDGIHNTFGKNMIVVGSTFVDPAVLIANCATVWAGSLSGNIYLEIEKDKHCDIISTSEGVVGPCLVSIQKEYYERLTAIIETYIEF